MKLRLAPPSRSLISCRKRKTYSCDTATTRWKDGPWPRGTFNYTSSCNKRSIKSKTPPSCGQQPCTTPPSSSIDTMPPSSTLLLLSSNDRAVERRDWSNDVRKGYSRSNASIQREEQHSDDEMEDPATTYKEGFVTGRNRTTAEVDPHQESRSNQDPIDEGSWRQVRQHSGHVADRSDQRCSPAGTSPTPLHSEVPRTNRKLNGKAPHFLPHPVSTVFVFDPAASPDTCCIVSSLAFPAVSSDRLRALSEANDRDYEHYIQGCQAVLRALQLRARS